MIIAPREGVVTIRIACPHCKYTARHSASHIEDAIKERKLIECIYCGKKFTIMLIEHVSE